MKVFNLYNKYHLGDNIFNILFFGNIIASYIVEYNIQINYYCQEQYIRQVSEFNNCENIYIKNINEKPENSLEVWINSKYIDYRLDRLYFENKRRNIKRVCYDVYYVNFFNTVLWILNIDIRIQKFYYKDRELISRYKLIKNKFSPKYNNIDILVVNSEPLSEQYNYNKSEWDKYIQKINNDFSVITTTKVDGVNCTMDDNLTVKDIAALSMKVKIIIAINSGVVPGLLNKYTLNNVKKIYIFDDRCEFSYTKFQNKDNINEITYYELKRYILYT